MKILAIETATDACSCALWCDGECYEQFVIAPRAHGALILAMVEAVLAEGEVQLNGLDGFAFGCGPGSFTGLRIAAGVIQGLAFAVELPVAPISSLAALAQGIPLPMTQILTIQDARMGEVYCGAFRRAADAVVRTVTPAQVCRPELMARPETQETWVVVGDGWQTHGDVLAHVLAGYEIIVLPEYRYPHAADVARLGALALAAGPGIPAEQAVPIYIRDEVVRTTMAKNGEHIL